MQRLHAHDGVDRDAVGERDDQLRIDRATALRVGGAAAMYGLANATLPETAPVAEAAESYPWMSTVKPVPLGKVHTVPSNAQTVVLGQFDPTRAPIVTVDSGDVVVYPNTWTHFLNKLQPGVPIETLGQMRRDNPGRGPHSIIGPVAVNGAMPGDVVQVRFLNMRTIAFGANFHNSSDLNTGVLPTDFPQGHVHYFELRSYPGYVVFNDKIKLQLRPFQGTFGIGPKGNTAISSVPPNQWGGNMDCKEMTAGSSLFLPVFHPGGLLFTGDSHALQADGEVNLTAIETGMEELRIQVILHQNAGYDWPMIETPTHWLALGFNPSLNTAMQLCLRNAIDFLSKKAGLSRADAYSLCSVAVDFRVSQMVDANNGIHAMIPKSIFAKDYVSTIAIV
ncbi:MAG TPA: acetamidase/formamidase family protein [Candidatus Binatia bacterium]|nr:acetamidase/formamidase family protein [Candidatus Binatia bacterium]